MVGMYLCFFVLLIWPPPRSTRTVTLVPYTPLFRSPDMELPRMNNWSFWILPFAFILLLSTFFMPGGAPAGGWTMYPPLMLQGGANVAMTIFAVHMMGISSIMGAINIIATVLNMRAPGMDLIDRKSTRLNSSH